MMEQKIYVGGATEKSGNFGSFHKISFKREDLELMMQNLNAKGYVNLNMNKRKEPSQYGQTHSLVIDTWEPSTQDVQQYQQGQHPQHQAPVYMPPQEAFKEVAPMVGDDPEQTAEGIDEQCPF
jgi:hypothetical protein